MSVGHVEQWHIDVEVGDEGPGEEWTRLGSLEVPRKGRVRKYPPTRSRERQTDLEDDSHELVPMESDRPVALLLPLSPGQSVRVQKRDPASLAGPSRAVEDGEYAMRIVECRYLCYSQSAARRLGN